MTHIPQDILCVIFEYMYPCDIIRAFGRLNSWFYNNTKIIFRDHLLKKKGFDVKVELHTLPIWLLEIMHNNKDLRKRFKLTKHKFEPFETNYSGLLNFCKGYLFDSMKRWYTLHGLILYSRRKPLFIKRIQYSPFSGNILFLLSNGTEREVVTMFPENEEEADEISRLISNNLLNGVMYTGPALREWMIENVVNMILVPPESIS